MPVAEMALTALQVQPTELQVLVLPEEGMEAMEFIHLPQVRLTDRTEVEPASVEKDKDGAEAAVQALLQLEIHQVELVALQALLTERRIQCPLLADQAAAADQVDIHAG